MFKVSVHEATRTSVYHTTIEEPNYPFDNGCIFNLNNTFYPPPDEWGRVYTSYMKDLTDYSSIKNMGVRWVIDISYKDFDEVWTMDLGPRIGDFNPKYAVVAYESESKTVVANIQSDNTQKITPRRCDY